MTMPSVTDLLSPAPAGVRARMLGAARLEPGAAAVVGRFFEVLKQRGEPAAAPSRATFDAVAKSEPTLATLLRALRDFAPDVCLAGGREARKAWYAGRSKSDAPRRRARAPLPTVAPASWPAEWALFYPALLGAPVTEKSRRRYADSINQLADVLPATDAEPDWSRYMAFALFEALTERGAHPTTVANYLEGLICLGKHAGVGDAKLAGLREMHAVAKIRAADIDKRKIARLADLSERGGYELIAKKIGTLRDDIDTLPAGAAAAERLRQMAAVLAVEINVYGRTADVAGWRLGVDLVREPWGAWRLTWRQGKTSRKQAFDELWPEVGEVLDDLILAGRPRRYVGLRYEELRGKNWLTHGDVALADRQPSQLVKDAIGVPLHDLRTLVADFVRQVDPARARDLIATMLGHGNVLSGEAYRAACEGEAATLDWHRMRGEIAANGVPA